MKISRRSFILSGFVFILGVFLMNSLWFEKFLIEKRFFFLGAAKKNSYKLKFIQVSDLHLNHLNLNKEHPDLILITGDAIDKAQNLDLLEKFLQLIDINIKKVAILGNWEYWGDVNIKDLKTLYQRNNCELLVNDSKQYEFDGYKVSITGIDDYIGGTADYELAIKNYIKSDYHIVLTHCPQHRDIIQKLSQDLEIDLVLSGHTHGGQINLFGFIPFKPQGSGRYLKGWYKESKPHLYVSKGIGTSILPLRFRARAEIGIFHYS